MSSYKQTLAAQSHMSLSTIGNRQRIGITSTGTGHTKERQAAAAAGGEEDSSCIRYTEHQLQRLIQDSEFLNTYPSRSLPEFSFEEVQLGALLGAGEFGQVYAVESLRDSTSCLHVEIPCSDEPNDCVREDCGLPATSRSSCSDKPKGCCDGNGCCRTGKPEKSTMTETTDPLIAEQPISLNRCGIGGCDTEKQGELTKSEHCVLTSKSLTGTTTISVVDDGLKEQAVDVKALQGDFGYVSDLDDDQGEEGELKYLKEYMINHVYRCGTTRYAIKRLRGDFLDPRSRMEAAGDLACEARILASISHPNICRIRATTGTPGHADFGIILDRLQKTLRGKIEDWAEHVQQLKTGFLGRLRRIHTEALQALFLERLVAVYDVARALKYLHDCS